MSWRDLEHPEAGGAEVFAERNCAAVARAGHRVTLFSSRVVGRPLVVPREGFHVVRAGRRFTVYPRGLFYLWRHRHDFDVVVDVQNGVPFWAPLVFRGTVVLLVHHVHREQWFSFFPRPVADLGWWLESRLSPRVYRHAHYVTVSQASRAEIAALGVEPERINVVLSGNEAPADVLTVAPVIDPPPSIVVLGRLVPHKRVELAIDAVASLCHEIPDVRLTVIGGGEWRESLTAYARRCSVADRVTFTGPVDESTKHRLLHEAAVMAMPSAKEGWGLTIVEAGYHGVPAVAFNDAGGTRESIIDGRTGLLVDTAAEFTAALRRLLTDADLRARLGAQAQAFARGFSWERTGEEFTRYVESLRAR